MFQFLLNNRKDDEYELARYVFQDTKPTFEQINEFINNPLWDKLNKTLVSTYNVEPKLEYSKCSMQRGWNVKYKKKR